MKGDGEESGTALEASMLEAGRLAEDGEEAAALELLLEVERDHGDDAGLLCMIGVLAAHGGASGMAADYFGRCLARNPMDPAILVSAGAGLAALGDPGAEPALRLAALTAPEHTPARMHYGAFLVRAGMMDAGLDELHAARTLDPGDADVRRELGIAYLLAGRGTESIDEFEAGLGIAADDTDLRLLFGLSLIQEQEVDRAAEELYPLGPALAFDGEVQALLSLVFHMGNWEEEAWIALSRAEETPEGVDPAWLAEVEDALETGSEAVRALLLDEIAPTMLRDRIFGG